LAIPALLSTVAVSLAFLTGPSDRDPAAIALDHVRENLGELETLQLSDRYTSLDGVTHLVWKQRVRGVEVDGTFLGANVAADGRLINVTGDPVADLELTSVKPAITAREALGRPARLVVVPEGPRLAWRAAVDGEEVVVDALDGDVLERRSLVSHANKALVYDLQVDRRVTPRTVDLGADPSWIDRSEGGTKLQGNNAHAMSFVEFTGDPVEVAQAGGDWAFPFAFFDHAECPASGCTFDSDDGSTRLANREAHVTQAFYWVNRFHDHAMAAPIGFDEASRNFQHVNASGAGLGGDAIDVQAAHSIPGAQWRHAAEGSPPEMRLGRARHAFGYPWDVRLGDSAAVVYHEYGHGLTGRLVGDGSGACCAGAFGGALGEGWADWYAMDLLVADGLVADGPAPGEVEFASYYDTEDRTGAIDCPVSAGPPACPGAGTAGPGGYTFGDFTKILPADPLEEHTNGEIWSQTLWDLRTRLGARTARCIVTGGVRLLGGAMTFLDARDAILQSAAIVGVPQAAVWEVFAARGMGPNALLTNPPTDDFSVPASLPAPPAPSGDCGKDPAPSTVTPDPPAGSDDPPVPLPIAAALGADVKRLARAVGRLDRRRLERRGFAATGVQALTAGRFALQLATRGTTIAKGSRAAGAAGRYAIKLVTTKAGRKLLRRGRRIEATLTLRFTDAAGVTRKRSAKLVLKR
jgi:extracellular elastinolytic metalloproteinase